MVPSKLNPIFIKPIFTNHNAQHDGQHLAFNKKFIMEVFYDIKSKDVFIFVIFYYVEIRNTVLFGHLHFVKLKTINLLSEDATILF